MPSSYLIIGISYAVMSFFRIAPYSLFRPVLGNMIKAVDFYKLTCITFIKIFFCELFLSFREILALYAPCY